MAAIIQQKEEKFKELEQYIDSLPDTKGELIRVLHKAQGIFGFLPEEVQRFIAKKMKVSTAKVFGVVSFYSFFTMEPKGEVDISICLGTACYVRGAEKILTELKKETGAEVGKTTPNGKFSITGLRCIGACGLAPVFTIGEKVYGRVTPEQVKDIIAQYK
ncbi:complex I 24 kDa subunit family protein [Anaerotalea alkaliphila]|uniref:NAD(P)H-dependent oxidoreductase subunit E n=1 Tax=Anaerotalea alkaliphila TaxID=2662126 RepID=A0A7X5HVY1_9FIRM|nr:NAD(P)H-dependent oxidoreductase subunit E [Anaerotalea alkaliphila]NDL67647.1 NAD(P)H-dependent oxidoreductase subunit E [Anaerotalea alkaliphila]